MPKWEQAPIVQESEVMPKWKQAPLLSKPSTVSPEGVRPPERPPAPLKRKRVQPVYGFATPSMAEEAMGKGGLAERTLKQLANIVPEIIKGTTETAMKLDPGGTTWLYSALLNRKLKQWGIPAGSIRDTRRRLIERTTGKVPELEIKPAETIGEKAVDITTGISKFMIKLAALRKLFPNMSEGVIWEMENLSTGGKPGVGIATHGVFKAPGKIIKGVTIPAKIGKVGLEAAGLATLSAIEQKIDTGEIDPVQIGIAAGIPVALRTPKAIKRLIRAKHPKVINAVAVTHPELIGRLPEQRELIKTALPIHIELPQEAIRTLEQANKAIKSWSKKAKMLNKTERKQAVRWLRKQQAARGRAAYKRAREAGIPRVEAFRRARAAYKGKARVPEIEPLRLTAEQRDFYDRKIEQAYPGIQHQFQATGAAGALDKMTQGHIPTNYEFGLLEPIFGRDATKKLFMDLIKKRPFSGWEVPALAIQFFKTKFGLDIQTFRQARSLAARHPILYLQSAGINARAYVNNKYAEKMFTAVQKSPGYGEAEKFGYNFVGEAGYSSKRLEYYALGLTERLLTSKYKPLRAWGRLLEASERGAVAGINNMQKGLYDIAAKQARKAGLQGKAYETFMRNRAKTHNTFMKILRVPKGKQYAGLRQLKQVANYMLFSPSMTVSRPLQIKALIANKGSRVYAGEVIASNIASIFATTAIPTIIGNQMRLQNPTEEPDVSGELNVLNGDWGKIRWHDQVFDLGMGDAQFYRTLARIGVSAYMSGKQLATGKQVTEFRGKKIPSAGETLSRYFETRETALIGFAKTMLTGKDWLGKPIPRFEATVRALSPEIIEATVEAGMADGLWESIAAFAGATTAVGIATYPVKTYVTREKFKDIIAKQAHNKNWDELTLREQSKLRYAHKNQFDFLNEKVKEERVKDPKYDAAKYVKQEEHAAGERIRKILSERNQDLVAGINVGINRRPKNRYLNDERYNRYMELTAQYIEERLNRVDFTGYDDRRRKRRVEVIVRNAKSKALAELKREIAR